MPSNKKDLQIATGITLLGGLMLLLFSAGEAIRLSTATYVVVSFVAAACVILSATLFRSDPAKHLRYGLLSVFSSLFLFFAERLANILTALEAPSMIGNTNPYAFFFQLGVLLGVIGGLLVMTYQEKPESAKAK